MNHWIDKLRDTMGHLDHHDQTEKANNLSSGQVWSLENSEYVQTKIKGFKIPPPPQQTLGRKHVN